MLFQKPMLNIDKEKDCVLSAIRLISLIFIIVCHIMQYYGFVLAGWFNVGVQMFFFLSGYLHGTKDINNELLFYKKKLLKILPSYYITVGGGAS